MSMPPNPSSFSAFLEYAAKTSRYTEKRMKVKVTATEKTDQIEQWLEQNACVQPRPTHKIAIEIQLRRTPHEVVAPALRAA
jgi:hypothetical protein